MDFLYLRAAVILLRDENVRSRQGVFILFVSTQFHSNFIKWRYYNCQKYVFSRKEELIL